MAPPRIRELRQSQGVAQAAFAQRVGLSRQSLSAIESGRATPAVDVALRIARALGTAVEALFVEPSPEAVDAEPWSSDLRGRATLAEIGGRWVAYPLAGRVLETSADGLVPGAGRRGCAVEPLSSLAEARDNLMVLGCAGALGLLADRLNRARGAGRFVWLPTSSTRALEAVGKRLTHVGGVHLVDGRSGEANLADVRRHAGREPLVLITLARWEAGLVVAAGNPKQLRGVADLERHALRLAVRESGSGARRLLERELRRVGLSEALATQAAVRAAGHFEIAQAVALGAADVGVATRDVALGFGLDFLPLAEERYDLVVPRPLLDEPRIARLLDLLSSGAARRELQSLGYDVRQSGERVAEVNAA